METFLKAINNYKDIILSKNEYITNDITLGDDELEQVLITAYSLLEKLDEFIKEIELDIDDGLVLINVNQRNKYYKKYDLSKQDIFEIKKILRCINNCTYKRDSRKKQYIMSMHNIT
jgi:hypothetical protein